VKCEKINDKATAIRELKALSTKLFPIPGDNGFVLGGLYPSPANKTEGDLFRSYFKQTRDELALRLLSRLFNEDGTKNKWWQSFSKRKFMGKEFKD
jgi:actin related protein 2/3 complex subunit 3